MKLKFTKWVLFSFIISLIPLLATYIILSIYDKDIEVVTIIANGQPQLISVALLANGLGEIITKEYVKKIYKSLLSGLATILLLFSAIWFGAITSYIISNTINGNLKALQNLQTIQLTMIILFFGSVLLSCLCVIVGEREYEY